MKVLRLFSPFAKLSVETTPVPPAPAFEPVSCPDFTGATMSSFCANFTQSAATLPLSNCVSVITVPALFELSRAPKLVVVNPKSSILARAQVGISHALHFSNIDRNVVGIGRSQARIVVTAVFLNRPSQESDWVQVGAPVKIYHPRERSQIRAIPSVTMSGQGHCAIQGTVELEVTSDLINPTHNGWMAATAQPAVADPGISVTAIAITRVELLFDVAASSNATPIVSVAGSLHIHSTQNIGPVSAPGSSPDPITVSATSALYNNDQVLAW